MITRLEQVNEILLSDMAEGHKEDLPTVLIAALEMGQRDEVRLIQKKFMSPIMLKLYE